mmetsp:Transcript_6139/g.9595  ORF Transcript_6139/g.9595 Transcript_6139/m.9595 type:complete len:215 (-) Transcript_6139:925-1569(-)
MLFWISAGRRLMRPAKKWTETCLLISRMLTTNSLWTTRGLKRMRINLLHAQRRHPLDGHRLPLIQKKKSGNPRIIFLLFLTRATETLILPPLVITGITAVMMDMMTGTGTTIEVLLHPIEATPGTDRHLQDIAEGAVEVIATMTTMIHIMTVVAMTDMIVEDHPLPAMTGGGMAEITADATVAHRDDETIARPDHLLGKMDHQTQLGRRVTTSV